MTDRVTYAALTAVTIAGIADSQVQFVADLFTPQAYGIIVAVVSIINIAVRAWRDWQAKQEH